MRALIERFLVRLLRVAAQRESASRAKPEAPARRWRLPSVEELDRARGWCAVEDLPQLKICRGPNKGCARCEHDMPRCPDCYTVPWYDSRPSAEIRAAMERGDA